MTQLSRALGALCFILIASSGFAQKDFTEEADRIYATQNYHAAIDAYKKAYPKEKKKEEKARILFNIAESYRLMQEHVQAEVWYAKAEAGEYSDPILYARKGEVLMIQAKYDEAMEAFKKASAEGSGEAKSLAEKGIESCETAIKMAKNPSRYKVEPEVQLNTKYFDYAAYYADKKFESLIFTSSRPGGSGNGIDDIYGEGFADIYRTERDNKGKWSSPVPLGETINSEANEGAAAMDDKFSELYFTRCKFEKNKPHGCQIYKARSQGQDWGDAELLDFGIDDTTTAGHPFVIDDELIIYASDMDGGQGGKDLWYIRYEKKTKIWGPPVNLGPKINTPGDELFPYVREHDGMLFFASNGHIGMGGLDIFKAESAGEMKWKNVENMGAPINSAANDFAIIWEEEEDRGYFSSDRPGGKGKDDIWSFMMPPLIFKLEGTITDVDTKEPLGGVTVNLVGTDGTVGETTTDPTGHYEFETRDNEERYILANTSYTIEVSTKEPASLPNGEKHRYLGSKGQETTVGLKESTAFVHDFALVCADCEKPIDMPQVFYPLGKWSLLVTDSINSKDSLEYLVNVLNENQTITIELAAHTDTRGSATANKTLSQKRAETCVNYLVERGIDPARMVPMGYGEEQPLVSDETIASLPTEEDREAAHQKNRRTVFRVISWDYVPPKDDASDSMEGGTEEGGEEPEGTGMEEGSN